MPTGILLANGNVQTLDKSEQEALANALFILRTPNDAQGFQTVQECILDCLTRTVGIDGKDAADRICSTIARWYTDTGDREYLGFITGHRYCEPLEEDELNTLLAVAGLLKSRSWLTEWFGEWAKSIAEKKRQHPSPQDVIKSLALELTEFEADVEIARRTMDRYPDLFEAHAAADATTAAAQ